MIGRSAAILTFFGLRIVSALLLLKLSAAFLPVSGFVLFSQFLAFASLMTLASIAGIQNGLIRQAAVATDPTSLGRTYGAALSIWLAAIPLTGLPIFLFRDQISILLAGTVAHADVVATVLAIMFIAGPGQIWCSLLTGSGRTVASLGAQAAGLVTGTGLAAWLILQGKPTQAAVAFASGSLLTAAVSFCLARRVRLPMALVRPAWSEIRKLLSYSAALAAIAAFNAVLLFGLRSVYRDSFDAVTLGHWMAANRISDMSTQLIGLFMLQAFVPRFSAIDEPTERRRFVLRCGMAGTAIMLLPLGLFSIAAQPLVHVFLSDAYLPAIGMIRTYMAGDALRVWTSLAIFSAFASGAPLRFAKIEITVLASFGALAFALVGYGYELAAPTAYLAVHATVASCMVVLLLLPALRYRIAAVRADTA